MLIFNTANCISIVHHNYQILLLKKNLNGHNEQTNHFYFSTIANNEREREREHK